VHGVSQRSPFDSETVAPLGVESTVQASDRPRVIVAQPLPIPASNTIPAAAVGRNKNFIEFSPVCCRAHPSVRTPSIGSCEIPPQD
jgi:hypothetical protein